METKSAILKRKSCRKYNGKHIDSEVIKMILEAGMAAPSAINRQPWEFYIIKNKDVQETLKSAMPYSKYNSDLLIVVCGNLSKEIFIKSQEFFVEDCSAAIENMLISATDLGVSSCWTAVYPSEKRMNSVREILKIKKSIIPFAIVHFGYCNDEFIENTKYNEKKIHVIE